MQKILLLEENKTNVILFENFYSEIGGIVKFITAESQIKDFLNDVDIIYVDSKMTTLLVDGELHHSILLFYKKEL